MSKVKTPLTREEKIKTAANTLVEVPTTTKVKAWSFKVEKQTYVILSFRNMIDYINVYPSTRAGRKTTENPIVSLISSMDHLAGLQAALEILIPE